MKKLKYIVVVLFFYLLILFFTSISMLYSIQDGLIFLSRANLDLELFLPSRGNNEIRCVGYFFTDSAEGELDF